MRKTVGYNKDKNGIQEFIKMKPNSEIKGKVTVQLINDDTKEVEQEVFTENVRMKWLDYQIYINGLMATTPLYNLKLKYCGYSTTSGHTAGYNGYFKYLVLFGSNQGEESEKISSDSGNVIGYCGTDEVYTGTDPKRGSFNQSESYIKQDSNGNLVMHNVYEFPSYSANGTTTHIGYSKNPLETMSYKNYICYGSGFSCTSSMPSPLIPNYSSVIDGCSWNCYNTGKNTFLFVLSVDNKLQLIELNIATGEVLKKMLLTVGEEKYLVTSSAYPRCIQISKDGKYVYILAYLSSSFATAYGVEKSGWNLLTFDTSTGIMIDFKSYGEITVGSTSRVFGEHSVGVIDEKGNGNLIMFGSPNSYTVNYIQEVNINDGTCVKCVTPYESSDNDNVSYNHTYRGTLLINEKNEIVYRRSSYYNTDKNHLVWDRNLNLIRRYKDNKDRINLNMNIIGHENLSIGTTNSNTSDFTWWGIFDKTNRYQVNTLTKLPSPIVKTSNFTMRVQYDLIFEMPNILDGFIENSNV